ncbi:MAG: lytic murein transglycosylase [Solirubrobacterales bacterium]|nr:lytic murein transglycosylase [Solirubrobacterales bacterium]
MGRSTNAATVSAAAIAVAAAIAGPAGAADSAASTETTPATSPTTTTPTTTPTTTTPGDLGTIPGTVDVTTPPKVKEPKQTAADKRREAARLFLIERRKASQKLSAQTKLDIASSPFAGLGSPLMTAPLANVSNAALDSFRVPPFLLPIYQAAGVEYGIRWEVLAAINEIETDYGRNLSTSSAGAMGWMQFMPGTWETYGVDANHDGVKDPNNPVDAIFAAARYLKASGANTSIEKALFSYNHADWYVADVLKRAKALAALPADLISALTGLTMGRSPITGTSTYSKGASSGVAIYGQSGAAAVAVQDGQVVEIGRNKKLGSFVRLRDVYGNTYTYSQLDSIATQHVVPRTDATTTPVKSESSPVAVPAQTSAAPSGSAAGKERLFAEPQRPASYSAGGSAQVAATGAVADAATNVGSGELGLYLAAPYSLRRDQVALRPLRKGSQVIAGTILGRVGAASLAYDKNDSATQKAAKKLGLAQPPHLRFEIRPAGTGAPRIDPTPILDGWKLLTTSDVYRASSPMLGSSAGKATIGQILLMSKEALERRVLADPALDIYACGRQDIQAGVIDRRVLATMEFLASSGDKLSITSLNCGHGFFTASGNVSEHSSGNAMDIASVNGISIMGNQGAGSITDKTVRKLLTLQGTIKPHQIISLMQYAGTDNTYAMGDHDDHIHVGFQPGIGATGATGASAAAVLAPSQWGRLVGRLDAIENPNVSMTPSRYSVKVRVKVRQP